MRLTFKRIQKAVGSGWSAKRITWTSLVVILLVVFWFSLPSPMFDDPYATVVYDRHGLLLGARIADDGQWRFPPADSVPDKYKACVVAFEDRYFYWHPGVNLFSLFRALKQNVNARKVVSGGSTLTMQTIRLARKGKPRTVWEKLVEIWLAFRLEMSYSKGTILAMYASHAPYGGNQVGLSAAAWRYFGRPPEELSWAEAAVLAVLPNAPAAIHPGRNREVLLEKRNRLLKKLAARGIIDQLTCSLACEEPLPGQPLPLPDMARHLVANVYRTNPGQSVNSALDAGLQQKVNEIASLHQKNMASIQVFNSAVLVIDLNNRQVLAYMGNSALGDEPAHSPEVDIIQSSRSTGSILKPFLYAAMMDAGDLLPGMLLPDIPSYFSGFSPKNFSLTYDGAVPASNALARSLNVPAVYLLKEYGVQPFYDLLKKLGISTLTKSSSHYGLSLILGGAEASLWEISTLYMNMGRTLNVYASNYAEYSGVQGERAELLFKGTPSPVGQMESRIQSPPLYSAGAAWLTLSALRDVNRPEEEEGWKSFASSREIAWKTGTSFGFRDAWAIGETTDYLVGVWVGNADGEGRPGLTGVSTAAPLMFEVFRILPQSSHWFPEPYDELEKIAVCRQSGHRPSIYCTDIDSITICLAGAKSEACPYHRLIHVDETGSYQVNADCYPADKIRQKSWFVLPPSWAWYYRHRNPMYQPPPPFLPGCSAGDARPMQFIYPAGDRKIYLPTGPDGKPGKVVFEAAHQAPSKSIYWHLDDHFIGMTRDIHKISLQPEAGEHVLTIVDEDGAVASTHITVVGRR
jgi:penicillin-binding protein 1C